MFGSEKANSANDEWTDDEIGTLMSDAEPAPAPDTAPVPTETAAPAPAGSPTPPDQLATTETPAAPAAPSDAAPAAVPASPVGSVPPTGQPFTFRVDGREVPVPGAYVVGNQILVPKEAWDRHVRPNVADRSVWREKEAGYQRQLQQASSARSDQELRANALLEKFGELTAKGPQAMAEWLDNYYTNLPVLEAQARASAAERRAAELMQVQQSQVSEQRQAQEVVDAQHHLSATLEQYLQQPEFKALAPEGQELLQELWTEHQNTLFIRADRDYPEYGLKTGELAISYDALNRLLSRRAAQAQKIADQVAKFQSAATLNAAAVQRPPVVPPRRPNGQFTTPPAEAKSKPRAKTTADLKAEMDADFADAFEE